MAFIDSIKSPDKSKVEKKTPNITKGTSAKEKVSKKERTPERTASDLLDSKASKTIGQGIVNSMKPFLETFTKQQERIATKAGLNLNVQKRVLMDAFAPYQDSEINSEFNKKMAPEELLENLDNFRAYLDETGESVESFGKEARMSKEKIEALKDSLDTYTKTQEEMSKRERVLKKAGLATDRELVDGRYELKVLNNAEIRVKQQEIIDLRKQIEDKEKEVDRQNKVLGKERANLEFKIEQGMLEQEEIVREREKLEDRKEAIEDSVNEIESLNDMIFKIRDKGVKEVQKVLTGFAGAIVDTYTELKKDIGEIADNFLPGPIQTVFRNLVQTVETLVGQILDFAKPITGTIKMLVGAPRYLLKKIGGKTDEEVDAMFKPMKEMFMKPIRYIGKQFKLLGMALKPFKMKILVIVGVLALVGLAIFLLFDKLKQGFLYLKEKIMPIFEKLKEKLQPLFDKITEAFDNLRKAVIAVYEFLFGKSDEKVDQELQDKKEELVTSTDVSDSTKAKTTVKAKEQLMNAIIAKEKEDGLSLSQRSNKNILRGKTLAQLTEMAKEKGVDKEITDRADVDRQIQKSQIQEEKYLQSKKLFFTKEEQKEFKMRHGHGGIALHNILRNKKLTERLQDNEQFKEAMLKKAEFDAEQAALLKGEKVVANTGTSIQNYQTAGVYGKSPTRDIHNNYVDVNAMSYGMAGN